MAKVEFGIRVSSVLLFVLVYCISLSNCADAGDEQPKEAGIQSSPAGVFHLRTLTEKQKISVVTIEFNCTGIDTKENRTNVDSMYRNVHKAVLERLNRRKSDMITITQSTSLDTTAPTSTMLTPTTIATTDKTTTRIDLGPNKKKRKKREESLVEYDANDLRFVEIDPETHNGILAMSLLLVVKESDDRDCGIILHEAVNQTNEDGTLDRVAEVPVVAIYRGLPANRRTMMSHSKHNYSLLIWPLVILFVIVLLIVIGVFIYWKKRQDKLQVTPANENI